jgi:hypothetical protein
MKIFTERINSKPSFLVHEKIRTAFAFTSRCFKRYQTLFMLQTTTTSYVFWWLKSLLTAYLPIWNEKLLTIRPHSSQQFSETSKIYIVGDGGVGEKNSIQFNSTDFLFCFNYWIHTFLNQARHLTTWTFFNRPHNHLVYFRLRLPLPTPLPG